MEVVVFDKLVQVDAQHFEANADMAPESEAFPRPDDVLAVLMIIISESLQDFNLNLTLLVEFLPVFKDLDRHMFLCLVIEAPENHTKCSSSQLLLDLIPICNLVLGIIEVVGLIIVEPVIVWRADLVLRVLILARQLSPDVLSKALVLRIKVEIVYHIIVKDFIPLIWR